MGGILLLLIASCSTTTKESARSGNAAAPMESSLLENSGASDTETMENNRIREKAEAILSSMTPDEKIGQLFILAMRHTAYGNPALVMDDYLKEYLSKYTPGGIILFSLNFQSPEQTRQLISDLQTTSERPLFIATDEEGGKVSRLGKQENMEVVFLPPAQDIGMLHNPELAEKAASVLAADLRDLGFNMNMAPVADISRNGFPDVIGNRSFGSDPDLAAEMVAAAVRGFQNGRISSVLKHFPGHGYVNGDTHNGMVRAKGDKQEFESVDFVPFRKGIEAGVDFIMTAHIQAPSLTGSTEPASLSYTIQTKILREELNFKGLIITDAMDMGAVTRYWSPGEAALKAFNAGADMILMPANIPEAMDYIKKAYANGEITEKRLNDSLLRILTTKIRLGLFDENYPIIERISEKTKADNHKTLAASLNLTAK